MVTFVVTVTVTVMFMVTVTVIVTVMVGHLDLLLLLELIGQGLYHGGHGRTEEATHLTQVPQLRTHPSEGGTPRPLTSGPPIRRE